MESQMSSCNSSSAKVEILAGRTHSSNTSEVDKTHQRGHRINDASLDATAGELRMRLDADFHYPVPSPANKYPPCSLCRWALKDGDSRDTRIRGASVSTCDKCNVSLCLACFKPFHTLANVEKLKSEVKKNHKMKNNSG